MSYNISDYSYDLPEGLIATVPAEPRDSAKMMVLSPNQEVCGSEKVEQLPEILPENTLIVVNNTKVIPARLTGQRKTGGKLELLLVQEIEKGVWECKLKNSKRMQIHEEFFLADGNLTATLLEKKESGESIIKFKDTSSFFQQLEKFGNAPIPPYIQKAREKNESTRENDLTKYQTEFAEEYGAIAAPTAGLHFTPKLIQELEAKGIQIIEITLHVGLGTFEPVRTDDCREHKMHTERFSITEKTAQTINQAKADGKKILAVGTTSVRALESSCKDGKVIANEGETDIFIYPPYQFQIVDQLLTNFHLPESTLLMLVSAFKTRELILQSYQKAIESKYRFYSFGDCMLLL
ncbi:MAG: S-adenosylmethionine:tRNA ribosyltransferase-isomerase [bacterium]|jgi:S-adenosylmethionine:tRNA ribosyltransferase-isomerase